MKSLVLVSFMLFNVFSVSGHINFETSYKKAVKQAEVQNKLMFVDFTAEWCGPCQRLEEYVFSNPEVADFYNTNFINLQLDEKVSRSLMRKYDIHAFPTLMFIAPDKSILLKASGGMGSTAIMNLARSVHSIFDFKNRYYSDKKESATRENLVEILQDAIQGMASDYFESFINHVCQYLPDQREIILSEFSSYIIIDEEIENQIKNSGKEISDNKVLRDKLALKYFTANQFPKLSDVNTTCKKLESLNFSAIHESRIYLSTIYAFNLDIFSPVSTQNNQRLVYGKGFLLNYPHSQDKELLLSVLYYLLDQDLDASYYTSLIQELDSFANEEWTFIMHDIYAVALVKTGNKEKSIHHVQQANNIAFEQGLKYRPAISRIKKKPLVKP